MTLTLKAEKTRQEIFDAALNLFVTKGYKQTTMRDIATAAGRSIGLTYHYFDNKETLILALWNQLSDELVYIAQDVPEESFSTRFYLLMKGKYQLLIPYRKVLNATLSVAMNPESGVGIVSQETIESRDKILNQIKVLLLTSTDKPDDSLIDGLAILLYSIHLLTTLTWLYDRSSGQKVSGKLLEFLHSAMRTTRPLLALPIVRNRLKQLAEILESIFLLKPST